MVYRTPDDEALAPDAFPEIDLSGVQPGWWGSRTYELGVFGDSGLEGGEFDENKRKYRLADWKPKVMSNYESTALPRALPFATKEKKKKRRLVQRAAAPTALQTLRAW